MGVGLFVGVWIARYLGPEQFGLFSFATAFVGLFGAVAGFGLQGIVVRDIIRDPAGKEETLGTAAMLQLLGGLLAYGMILGAIFWLRPDDPLSKTLVAILGSTMLFKASEVVLYWFESQVLSKYIVWVQNGCFLLFAAIKVGLILNHAPLIAFAWATMAEALWVALLMFVMLGLRGPGLRKLQVTITRAKGLLKDSWPLLLSGIAVVIYMKIDQIMLGQMVGDEAVGIYSAAVRISEVWYFIPMVIVASVFPDILNVKERSETVYQKKIQQLYDLLLWLAIIIALIITLTSSHLVNILFGSDYLPSSDVLAIHTWAGLFVALGVAKGKWALAENQHIYSILYQAIGLILNIVFNYYLIPILSASGAAIATLFTVFSNTMLIPMVVNRKQRRTTLNFYLSFFAPFRYIRMLNSYRLKSGNC